MQLLKTRRRKRKEYRVAKQDQDQEVQEEVLTNEEAEKIVKDL